MNRFAAKTLTFLVAVSLLGTSIVPLFERNVAHAQAGAAFETNPAVVGGITSIAASEALGSAAEVEQSIVTKIFNAIAWRVAKAAIHSMTRSIVNWINTGFEGSPAFVTDLNLELRNLGDAVARDFFTNLTANGGFDSPFLDRIVTGVGAAYYLNSSEERLQKRLKYTLNQYARDDRAFLDGDFEQGGFDAWFSVWLHQANNPIGAHYIAGTELANRIENEQFARLQDLMYGNGFRSWNGDCLLYDTTETSLGQEERCVKYDSVTPGSVIEEQLGITISSPLRQLELADSINEIVDALYAQMVTQIIGATGLVKISNPSSGGGRSALDRATDPNRGDNSGISQGFSYEVQARRKEVATFTTNWQRIRTKAQEASAAIASGSCGANGENKDFVASMLADATTEFNRGTEALAALDKIIQQLAAAGGATTGALDTSASEYSLLTSSGKIPTASDVARSRSESSNAKESLYTQLSEIIRQCGT